MGKLAGDIEIVLQLWRMVEEQYGSLIPLIACEGMIHRCFS
jgi:hypothetical protein